MVTPLVACMTCARPLDSLLTGGLQTGVAVLGAVVLLVIAALVRGVIVVLRHDARQGEGHDAAHEAGR